MNLQGKVALVTGSAQRVGRTIALSLAQRGCHLIIHYRHSKAEASETVRRAESLGIKVLCVQADLQKASSIRSLLEEIQKKFKRLYGFWVIQLHRHLVLLLCRLKMNINFVAAGFF